MLAENLEKFFERLNSLRNDRTVVGFARDCGIPQQTMANYCKGERIPSLEAFEKLCSANVVSADWMLGFTEDRTGTSAPATNATYSKRIEELEAELTKCKGEIDGLRFALKALGKEEK